MGASQETNWYASESTYLVNRDKPVLFMYGSNKEKSMYLAKWVTQDGSGQEYIPQVSSYIFSSDLDLCPVYEEGYYVKFIVEEGNFDHPFDVWANNGVRVIAETDAEYDDENQKHKATFSDYIVEPYGIRRPIRPPRNCRYPLTTGPAGQTGNKARTALW